ncbi:Pycsar system effector family protein [Kitasatospora sp. NPDC002040]|uniref:Pycsar system effector family protein n=1 Tax=Kitasatospora sp. NPDC002040 TaxID=3154661 RepID=UPI00331C3A4B
MMAALDPGAGLTRAVAIPPSKLACPDPIGTPGPPPRPGAAHRSAPATRPTAAAPPPAPAARSRAHTPTAPQHPPPRSETTPPAARSPQLPARTDPVSRTLTSAHRPPVPPHTGTDTALASISTSTCRFAWLALRGFAKPRASARTDNKSSLLLALTGGTLFAGATALGKAPTIALALATVGITAAAASALLALLAVSPRLDPSPSNGFARWAVSTPEQIREDLAVEDHRPAHLHPLSVLCERKMRMLQWACRCAAVAVLTVSAAAAVLPAAR